MIAVSSENVPEVGERMVILRLGMPIAVLNQSTKTRFDISGRSRETEHIADVHDDKPLNGQARYLIIILFVITSHGSQERQNRIQQTRRSA